MKGYTDFLMMLSPSDKVKAVVHNHKFYAAGIIGNYESMHSTAHISIRMMHRQKTFLTEPGILTFRKRLCLIPPVTLHIDGFDYFNHGDEYKTIYARISNSPETNQWFKILKQHLHIKEFMVPHITICRNIPVADFDKLWPYFKSIEWKATFTVNTLTVLQRETFASFAKWEPYTELPFEGKTQYSLAPPKPSLLKQLNSQQTSLF
ncbi:2'-5' RNA ligase family protein [Mucilaginibacter sp. UR6-11]|uniref:2'-5' RNA ligase family protein n=1 Tax=Mucilaginibacter sp. UR6-11 TaxID=1435644 RepID=UPI001E302FA3|nr:2'-5' RNA ligase family protein [Mucilaginibacter sp. UR6-11]MCC8426176.1 2'-5' RNA ligase family protein [Mucilaginibacter sp. UR6-11]